MKNKVAVFSAVNLTEGGPLTILQDCLYAASEVFNLEWRLIVLVHQRSLIPLYSNIHIIEFPSIKASWFKRLWFEWFQVKKISNKLNPDIWISLHDISPRVFAKKKVVYCHNATPFYKVPFREARYDHKLFVFSFLYKYLYRINIHSNDYVIVQQDWIRSAFRKKYGHKSIVVAHPNLVSSDGALIDCKPIANVNNFKKNIIFLYPALPRVFKNIEILLSAALHLPQNILERIEIRLTIDGTESRYSSNLVKRYASIAAIKYIGRQSRDSMRTQYSECDALLFPSKLETWGLPITEAKSMGKAMFVADLPYARETVGAYDKVSFINPTDTLAWSKAIENFSGGFFNFQGNQAREPAFPYARDWHDLLRLLIKDL